MVKLVRFDVVHLIAILSLFSYYCNSVGQDKAGQHKVRPCRAGQHAPICGAGRGWEKATTLQSTHDPACLPHCHPIQELQNTPYETLPSQLAKKKNVSIRVWHLSIWYEGSNELNSFEDSPWARTHACTCTHTLMHFRTCTHPPIQPIAQSCIHIHALADIHIHNHTHNHM